MHVLSKGFTVDDKLQIQPGTAQETLIIPLYARKKCGDKFPELYADPAATEICNRLNYDFSELNKKYDTTFYEFGALEGAMRQLDMMYEINDYLRNHPNASIVCLGCGLDLDARRCGNQQNKIFNVDFPDVIAMREELAGTNPRETNIVSDLTDLSWMDQVDARNGAVFYAAGVFHYLKKEDVKAIVLKMTELFPGCRLVFDAVGTLGYKLMMRVILKKHGMNNFGNLFYTNNSVKDLSSWSDKISVSSKGYMLGYYDMKLPSIKGIHRLLANIGDNIMHMQIVKIELLY